MLTGFSKSKLLLCLLVAVLCITPTSSGEYSDIAFIDATVTPSGSESRTTDINPNGSLLASGYEGIVAIHDADSLELIQYFEIESDVMDVEFSPDGSKLAFTRSGTSADTDTTQILDIESMSLMDKEHGSSSQPLTVQWSVDGNLLAVPNSNKGVDIIRFSDMQIDMTMNGEHNARVTCISYSTLGEYMLTGDESGRVVMWDSDGNPTGKVWALDSSIEECSFDSSDNRFAVLTADGGLSTWAFAGGSIGNMTLEKGSALKWSSDNSLLHVLEGGNEPRILTIDSTTLENTGSIYLAHQALDFSLKENEFGTREAVYVATNTGHLAVYGAMDIPEGYGESGSDLDGDNVPDTYDNDDDGDSILDGLDNNCQSVNQLCSKTPDISKIRSVNIMVNSTSFTVRDTFTLDSETSSIMRNLSRKSLIADAQLSQAEESLFAQSICQNMNKNHFMSSWKNVIQLTSGQLTDGHVECEVEQGMTLVAQVDYTTQVSVTFVLVFNLSEQLTHPFDFTLQSQPTATDSSLAQHAEMHPIDVTAKSTDSSPVYWSPWWIIEGELTISLEEELEEEPSFFGKVVDVFIDYPILFVPVFGIFIVALLGLIRRKNAIDLDFDDDVAEPREDEEEHDDQDSDTEDNDFIEEDIEQSDSTPTKVVRKPEVEPSVVERRTARRNPYGDDDSIESETTRRKVVRKPTSDVQPPVIARRTARKNPYDDDGPITKVKRRRLDSGVSSQTSAVQGMKASKRKIVSPTKKTGDVKTRRVKTHSEKDEQQIE